MSSHRKPEIQNDLPKITQFRWISPQNNYVDFIMFSNYSIDF